MGKTVHSQDKSVHLHLTVLVIKHRNQDTTFKSVLSAA